MKLIRARRSPHLAILLTLPLLAGCKDGTATSPAVETADFLDKLVSQVRGPRVVIEPRVVPEPRVVIDEEFVIPAGGFQARSFILSSVRPVRLTVEGVKDAAKGFTVYMIRTYEEDNFRRKGAFHYLPSFYGTKTTSFSHTEDLPLGDWTVVVQNTESPLRSMTVHVQVTTDPK